MGEYLNTLFQSTTPIINFCISKIKDKIIKLNEREEPRYDQILEKEDAFKESSYHYMESYVTLVLPIAWKYVWIYMIPKPGKVPYMTTVTFTD